MKRFLRSVVSVLLCIAMTVPFGAFANAAVDLPDKPTSASDDKVYVSYSSSNTNGTKATATGGDSPTNAYMLNQTSGGWSMLMGIKSGNATTVNKNKDFSAGGTMVIVGKGAITNTSFTFPKTANPLVITSKDGDTSYLSRNDDGTPNTTAQLGMFMTDPNFTVTFDGDVIFRDVVLINRQDKTSASTKAPTIYRANANLVIESSVEFASMSGNAKYTLDVTENGCAFLDALGFGKYTGNGTIVIGDSILETVKTSSRSAIFADFEGRIVDKNGNAVFSEPALTSDSVVFVAQDGNNAVGLTVTPNATAGGDSATAPVKTSINWANTCLYNKTANGAKIVAVGKFYAVGSYTFPNTATPIMITAHHDGVDYTSRNADGSLLYMSSTGANAGQYGMFMMNKDSTLTFEGDVIFDKIVILNRLPTTTNSTIAVNKNMLITKDVEFASMKGAYYNISIANGATLYLDADPAGFNAYTGTGTIVVGNEIINSINEDTFGDFAGKIVDEYGRTINFDEITQQPEDTTAAPEDTTITPEDTTATPEDTTAAPEDTTITPDDTTATPEDTTATPEDTTATPEDTTATPEDTTATPEDTTATPEEIFTIPERPVAPDNKVYVAYNAYTNLEGSVPSVDGGQTAMAPYMTGEGTWGALLGKDIAKNGATFVIVGKAYFGSEFTFADTTTTYVMTGKDGDVSYISYNSDGSYNTSNSTGQYGMFMAADTVTVNGNLIFENTVILNRKTPNSKFIVNGILVINDTVDFHNMGASTYALEVSKGGVVFLDSLGFGSYSGNGTIVIGDELLSQVKKADFVGFDGKVVDKNGCDIFPGSPAKFPSKDNYVYTADSTTAAGNNATADGGATAQAPYKTYTAAWKSLFSDKLKDGGYVIVVGKGYFGADCTLPATTQPVVFTALDMDAATSYISKDENGNLLYMNENGGHAGQYGMFMMGSDVTVAFDGDVIFDNIVILNRVTEEKNATIKVNKTMVVTNTVQFANMKDEPCDIHISEGAFLYLDADPAGFEIYSGTGTIVIGDNALEIAHAKHFREFEGRIVDKYGNDVIIGDKAISNGKTGSCDYEYNWLTDVLTITGNGAPDGLVRGRFAKEIIFGEGVTSIPSSFCYNNTNLTSLTLSSTITSIDKYAFANTVNLKTLVIPENSAITSVGKKAFFGSGITEIKFNSIENVGDEAFRGCSSLVNAELGNNVKSIGSYAFASTPKLESVTFDGTITEIANNTFEKATALKEIVLPDSVTAIGEKAFAYSSALEKIELPDSLISISEAAFRRTGISGSVLIPNGVKALGSRVFFECKNVTDIVLPESLESFGEYCFADTAITSISIPAGINKISGSAFRGCSKLRSVSLNDALSSIEPFAFYESAVESITIPESCTELGKSAFRSCKQLKTVKIDSQLTSIPDKTFKNCSSLESVNLPQTVTSLGQHAFADCYRLKDLALSAGLRSLGEYCLAGTGITSVTIPEGVTKIPVSAFRGCSALAEVKLGQSVTSIGDYAFYNSQIKSIELPASCTSIGAASFRSCTSMTSITINGAISSIPEKAFRSCSSLSTVTISDPTALRSIGAYAFFGCSALESFTVPSAVTSIGDYCFSYSGITEIELPASVTQISAGAFDHCAGLTSVIANGDLTSIGAYAFSTSGILSFVIPKTCTDLGKSIFQNCKSLHTVTVEAPITVIPQKTFSGCSSLKNTNIPESVSVIGPNAYYNCTSLTAITLPSGLETLSSYSFAGTSSLNTEITIPASCKVIGDSAFMYSAITKITVSNGVSTIGHSAFYKCSNLTSITIPESVTTLKDKCFAYSALTEVFLPSSVTTIGTRAFDPASSDTTVAVHTEADAAQVIQWAEANDTRVTLYLDYLPE